MLKCVSKLAKLAVVSSTLFVLGTTAFTPPTYAIAGITDHMIKYCHSKGYTGAGFGLIPGKKPYYGYFCYKGAGAKIIKPIPANEQY